MTVFRGHPKRLASGFTLVEILTVIVIIGILAGIAIPAITGALRAARVGAIRTEVENLNQAVEAYKLKYGDYPPDFSSWAVVQSHYRKIFPDIALSELTLLHRLCDNLEDDDPNQLTATTTSAPFVPSAMDRAEAIIWSLGGLSSDPQLPFTGAGGPLVLLPTVPVATSNATDPAVWQYNSARDNSLLNLELGDLTIASPDSTMPISFNNRVQSTDDVVTTTTFADVFPVYKERDEGSPYVYFDSRTYRFDAGGGILNGYATTIDGEIDAVRPVLDQNVNANKPVPSASGTTYMTRANALDAWLFMNSQTFQILSPGPNGRFGFVADFDGGNPSDQDPVYWQYPAGTLIRALATADDPQDLIVPNVERYGLDALMPPTSDAVREAYEKDNIASFSEKTFEDDLP